VPELMERLFFQLICSLVFFSAIIGVGVNGVDGDVGLFAEVFCRVAGKTLSWAGGDFIMAFGIASIDLEGFIRHESNLFALAMDQVPFFSLNPAKEIA